MENKISCVFMLSLKEIIMRRMVIGFWNRPDVLVSIENLCKCSPNYSYYSDEWHEAVENKITYKLSTFDIPSELSKQLLLIVRPIGLQIRRWKVFHERFLNKSYPEKVRVELGASVLEKLRWTLTGMIDYLQTAKELIQCEVLDITKSYRLACLYCLEESIPTLWKELPKKVQRKFIKKENISYIRSSDLPFMWPYILRGEQSKLDGLIHGRTIVPMSFNKGAAMESACNGNKFAIEYFFEKLLKDGIDVSAFTKEAIVLMSLRSPAINSPEEFPPENYGYVVCYLLSLMSYDEQMEIIKSNPIAVLTIFIEWPWQDIFLKIANLVWSFFSEEQHHQLLHRMNVYYSFSNYSNSKFFQECYALSPSDFKKSFVDYECRLGRFFPIFFDSQDSEAIEIVFRNLDMTDRVRLLSSERILKLFYFCILKETHQMVDVCLRVARLPMEDKERVKDAFEGFLRGFRREEIIQKNKEVWRKFIHLLYSKN